MITEEDIDALRSAELGNSAAKDPHPEQASLERCTLPNGVRVWRATGRATVRRVLGDAETFGSNGDGRPDPANGAMEIPLGGKSDSRGDITVQDGEDHARLRRLIAPFFTGAKVKALAPFVASTVGDCIDRMRADGPPTDFVESFGLALPSLVICELLGVPYQHRKEFQQRSKDRFDTRLPTAQRATAAAESRDFMTGLVATMRRTSGTGLIGTLVETAGDALDNDELVGLADILFLAGYETTAHMLSLGTLVLVQRHPELWRTLSDIENLAPTIEELLRLLTVVKSGVPRVATKDVELNGREIRAGERIICSLPSANRDPEFGSDADTFDPDRERSSHLAFGHGIHHCVGAPLARLELAISLKALARAFPAMRVAPGPESIVVRRASAVSGLESLQVTW